MYTAFYGLREKPFALSPDPRFLYLAGSHREALVHLLYGIEEGEGFISVTGEVGTGKTTLCRTLLERLDGDTELAFLFNPSRTALELLQSICAEFGLPVEGLARRSLMAQLNAFLVERKRQGRRVLLIIDEAQTLSDNTLEQVRLLSNLETSREKLIQILLLGQPELDRKLDGRGLRQLRQRISVRWKLEPLSARETRAYVRHRLSVAAGEPKDLFGEAALREVHRRTGGVPRLVNQLCDRALLAGYAARTAQIRPALVRAAAREIPDAQRGRRKTGDESDRPSIVKPWMFLAASIAIVGVALLAGLQVGRHGLANGLRPSNDRDSPLTRPLSSGEGGGATRPVVGANAPSISDPAVAGSPVARMIGFVPSDAADKPDVTALSPGLFARLLADRNQQLAMTGSQRAILEGFGRRVPALIPAPANIAALRSGFESRGLTVTPFDGGSIDLLRRLDHPVLLSLTPARTRTNDVRRPDLDPSDQEPRWLAITGFREDRARVAGLLSNRVVTVPIDELVAHWLETGIIVWEKYNQVSQVLTMGEEGQGVLWLQRSLAELHFFEEQPTGTFDSKTLVALTRFQRESGLVSDGIAGALTQIALYAQIDRYPVPRLSRDDTSQSWPAASTELPSAASPTSSPILNSTPAIEDRVGAMQNSGDRG
jgi:general secretion pathway protein A